MYKLFKFFLLLLILFFCVKANSQKLIYSGQFFYKNNVISQTDLEKVLSENTEAFELYQKTKSLDKTAKIFRNIGSVIFVIGTIQSFTNDSQNPTNLQRRATIAIIGLPFAFTGLGLQLFNQKKKKMMRVADIYNVDTSGNEESNYKNELYFGLSSSGVGFTLTF